MKSKLVLIASLLTILSSSVFAADADEKKGFFLEPELTVESGTTDVAQASKNVTSYGVGAKLGYHFHDTLFAGIDGRYSRPKYDVDNGDSVSADEYDVGATLGAQTPIWGIRVWGTYLIEGKVDPSQVAGVDRSYSGLNGYRLGAGVRVAAVSINLEYEDAKYNDVSITGTPAPGAADLDGASRGLIASVSFPLAF